MPRRFNFTGRKHVTRDHVYIRLLPTDSGLTFDARVELESYELSPNARVWLEAYRPATTAYRRFDLGHALRPVLQPDRSLASFEVPEGILFRLKVTDSSQEVGLLLAEADAIRPLLPGENEGSRKALLPVQPEDLGGEVWRLDYQGDSPVLLINSKLDDWNEVAHDPLFRSLSAPAILRELLTRILLIERDEGDADDPEDWRRQWIQFCKDLPGVGRCPLDEGVDSDLDSLTEWIEAAVRSFCQRSKLIESFVQRRKETQ